MFLFSPTLEYHVEARKEPLGRRRVALQPTVVSLCACAYACWRRCAWACANVSACVHMAVNVCDCVDTYVPGCGRTRAKARACDYAATAMPCAHFSGRGMDKDMITTHVWSAFKSGSLKQLGKHTPRISKATLAKTGLNVAYAHQMNL